MISIFTNWKSPVNISSPNDTRKSSSLEIDAVLKEGHSYKNNVTSYPVEKGSNITDHVKQQAEQLTIEGLTSNSPVRFISENFRGFVRGDYSNRSNLAFSILLEFAGFTNPKQPEVEPEKVNPPAILTIVTGYKVYTHMVITDLDFQRDSSSGEAVVYSIQFKKIRFVTAEYTVANKSSSLNGKAKNVENQSAKTANTGKQTGTKQKEQSLLYQAASTVKGWFN